MCCAVCCCAQTASVQQDIFQTRNVDGFVIEEKKNESNGDVVTIHYSYPKDILSGISCTPVSDGLAVSNLVNRNILGVPIEVYKTVTKPSGVISVVSGDILIFHTSNPYPKAKYSLESEIPLLPAMSYPFSPYHVVGCDLVKDFRYVLQERYNLYDDFGNLLEKQIKDKKKISYVYGYNGSYQTCVAKNAGHNQIAYSSFETNEKGNWTYADVGVVTTSTPIAGDKTYNLAGNPISRNVPIGGYTVSLWQFGTAASGVTVTGGASSTSSMVNNYPVTISGYQWTYKEWKVSNTNVVTVSGTSEIDELRLHPLNAQMETSGYIPLVGVSYSCDVAGRFNYFTYDDLGRLLVVKDLNGKIVKQMEYGIKKPE